MGNTETTETGANDQVDDKENNEDTEVSKPDDNKPVTEGKDEDKNDSESDEGNSMTFLIIVGVIILIIVLMPVLYCFIRRKLDEKDGEDKFGTKVDYSKAESIEMTPAKKSVKMKRTVTSEQKESAVKETRELPDPETDVKINEDS